MKKNYGHFLPIVKCLLLGIFIWGFSQAGFSQSKLFTIELMNSSVQEVFLQIQKESKFSFIYNDADINQIRQKDFKFKEASLTKILDTCLQGTGLTFEISDRHVIIRQQNLQPQQEDQMIIRGTVRQKNGEPIPGATILLKDTHAGVSTNLQGHYQISLPKMNNPILIFSCIGMKSQSIPCGNQREINVVLEEENKIMEEVIVNGYQSMRKSDVVGSIKTISASDVMMPAFTSIDQMLQGQVAGMVVTSASSRVGTSPKIRIRGSSTILGNQDPLWVVDGIIQPDPLPLDRNDAMVDDLKNILGNQISWLNPSDIENITILKDASAAAIYGSKAANGVIVISTKRGKTDRLSVNYTGNFTFRGRPAYGQFDLMDSHERIQFSREAFEAGALYMSTPVSSFFSYEGIMRKYMAREITQSEAEQAIYRLESSNTNWLKLLTQNALSHNHHLSLSGGNSRINFLASLSYFDQEGVEKQNHSDGMSGRLRIGASLHPKVYIDLSLSGSIHKNTGYAAGVNPLDYATTTSRAIPAHEEGGSRYFIQDQYRYSLNSNPVILGYNILNEMDHSYANTKSSRLDGTLNFKWDILPWLRYEFVGGINNNNQLSESYAGEQTNYIAANYRGYDYNTEKQGSERYNAAMLHYGGELYNSEGDTKGWNIQNKILIEKTFHEVHRLNILLGTEVISFQTKNQGTTIWGYVPERGERIMEPTPLNELKPIGSGYIANWGIFSKLYDNGAWNRINQTNHQFSLFGTLAYSYKSCYVLNASIRNDASNRFGQDQNKQFDPTYSIGIGWNAANEIWMEGVSKVINTLNIRASWGVQGNAVNSISPDLIAIQGGIKKDYDQYQINISHLPNPELSWERTKTWNLGLDLELLKVITMNLEYYHKSSNTIVKQNIALEYGINSMEINGGKVTNSGVEYTLNITPIRTKDWGWTIGLNSSKNWNKAKRKSIDKFTMYDYLDGASNRVLKEGYDLSSFWSFSFKGLNPDTGYPEFNLLTMKNEKEEEVLIPDTGDPSDFLVYSGKKEPDFTGGLNTRFRWKNLTFGADFALLLGAKKRLACPYPANNRLPASNVNLSRKLLKRWKKPGDEKLTDIPAVFAGRTEEMTPLPNGISQSMYYLWRYSDALVVNASFFRCRQMSLAWQMNEKCCAAIGAQNLTLSITLNNVFVIASKRFDGFDPELSNSIQPKMYSFSINVGF